MADNKPAQSQQLTKEEVSALVQEAVKAAVAAGLALSAAGKPADPKAPDRLLGKCSECKQVLDGCKGKHRLTVVFPSNPRYARPGWVGAHLNGVEYKSNDPGHRITVPADFYPEAIIAMWEDTEQTMEQGRVGFHNSGVLSPYVGRSFTRNADGAGWR